MNNLPKFIYFLVLIMLIIFIGLSIKFFGSQLTIITENEKYKWVKIEADIESIKLESLPNTNMPEGVPNIFTDKICNINYSYSYNNETYNNSNIGLNKNMEYSNWFHSELFEKLKSEQKIMIYINPKNPNSSTIIKYDFIYRKFGSGIITLSFVIFLSFILYQNYKYPSNYIANQIKLQ